MPADGEMRTLAVDGAADDVMPVTSPAAAAAVVGVCARVRGADETWEDGVLAGAVVFVAPVVAMVVDVVGAIAGAATDAVFTVVVAAGRAIKPAMPTMAFETTQPKSRRRVFRAIIG